MPVAVTTVVAQVEQLRPVVGVHVYVALVGAPLTVSFVVSPAHIVVLPALTVTLNESRGSIPMRAPSFCTGLNALDPEPVVRLVTEKKPS